MCFCCGNYVKGLRSRGTCGIGEMARARRGAEWRQMAGASADPI
ncbi:BQ2448_2739 [Microbotryum intermedium]|uniref:BQ2448_2739 protein n=1 Tax=Microbotryum intermedium TaxID=269621 RepID=A0A238FG93_9BASI|nr:BQ2448_2739 [Microbotryum intermedium]